MRYCQEVFLLEEEAAKEIVKGCQKDKDTCMYESGYAPTVCHHHYAAVGDTIPLEYNTLRLSIKIQDPESPLFSSLMQDDLVTRETADLHGFDGLPKCRGTIAREWEWLSKDAGPECSSFRLSGPNANSKMTKMSWAEQRVDGILLGIECSAPMKEDCFGNAHTVDAKSKEISAFGKRKWRDYRRSAEEVPASLGGTCVTVDVPKFMHLQAVCDAAALCSPTAGRGQEFAAEAAQQAEILLFQSLLPAPCSEWDGILGRLMAKKRPSV